MKNPIETFQTQFATELPTMLKRTSCGIASLYSGLRYLENDVGTFPDFVTKYVSSNRFNIPAYYAQTSLNGKPFEVPIFYDPNDTPQNLDIASSLVSKFHNGEPVKVERRHTPQSDVNLAFTLLHGFDHRGINAFLKEHNLPFSAELIESNRLPTSLTDSDNSIILASVEHKHLGYPTYAQIPTEHISTHIITIYKIFQLGGTTVALFTDPAFIDPREALQIRSLEALKQCTAKSSVITLTNR